MTQNTSDEQGWSLVQLKPNGLAAARRNLERQGFQTFMPQVRTTQRISNSFRETFSPLFPGYLFTEINWSSSPWRRIDSTLGVARIVRFGDRKPAAVSLELIQGLRARCDGTGILGPMDNLSAGDRVRILRGPFANFVSTIEDIGADRRIWVLMDLLGRKARVSLDPSDVVAS